MKRRRFLKLTGTGYLAIGSGFVGMPIGACSSDPTVTGDPDDLGNPDGADRDSEPVDLSSAEEMTEAEAEDFTAEVDSSNDDVRDLLDDQGRLIIPPGQRAVETIPVLGSNADPRNEEEWEFYVRGEVAHEQLFSWQQFSALEQVDLTCNLHCVTGWTALDTQWSGVRVADLLELAGATAAARFVVFDCEGGYTTNIPIEEARKPNVLIATGLFGAQLPTQYGGLARGLVPDLYLYKSGKWVVGIRVLNEDEPGFWETRGYSNTADPWTQDRHS